MSYKISPPLRKKDEVTTLWQYVIDKKVDCIGSDHAPHTKDEKQGSFPPAGMPGVQETISVMFTELIRRVHDPTIACSLIAELVSLRPAKLFRIQGKGRVALNYDADLVIFDPFNSREVAESLLWSKCKWSPYEGSTLKGIVRKTLLRGNIVFDNVNVIGEPSGQSVTFEV